MSLRFRTSVLVLILVAGACQREERQDRGKPLPETAPLAQRDARARLYQANANQLARGETLFAAMNCSGCHSHGGGGMGPALMDAEWRYGGTMPDIVSSILDGRPNGMPAWRGKLTEEQAWQLAAYVRSLSGQIDKDVVSSREDEISGETWSLTPRQRVEGRAEYRESRPKQ